MVELVLKTAKAAEAGAGGFAGELNVPLYNGDGTPRRLVDVMQDLYNSMGDESFANPKKEVGDLQEKARALDMVMGQPSCHECLLLGIGCPIAPKWGEGVRINCFMYKPRPDTRQDG